MLKVEELFGELASLKTSPQQTAIFSDLDGTLSEIAPTPEQATITSEMRSALENLSRKYCNVSIITGRDASNAKKMIGLDGVTYVGNHGLEKIEGETFTLVPEVEKYAGIADSVVPELSNNLLDKGILIENKRFGVAIHYRLAENKAEARAEIMNAVDNIADRFCLKISEGRNVVELKPDVKYNKGDAVRDLAQLYALKYAVFFGDDITDVDAFKELKRMRNEGPVFTICIAVASDEIDPVVASQADYTLDGVDEVRKALEWLAETKT